MRCAVAADRNHAWSLGMLLHFHLTYKEETSAEQWAFLEMDPPVANRIYKVLAKLCALVPLP